MSWILRVWYRRLRGKIDLVVVAPDDPLSKVVDAMTEAGIRAFGPTADAAYKASKVLQELNEEIWHSTRNALF